MTSDNRSDKLSREPSVQCPLLEGETVVEDEKVVRDSVFYRADGDCILRVGDTLFKVSFYRCVKIIYRSQYLRYTGISSITNPLHSVDYFPFHPVQKSRETTIGAQSDCLEIPAVNSAHF
jgi:hypothetical protein